MEITATEPRRHRLSQLFLDGEAAVKVDTETLLQQGWKPGMEMTDEELHDLLQASDNRRAKEKALYLLEYRSHSKKELTDKISRTASREAAEAAAQRMEELGLINDEAYARELARSLLERKGYGVRRARQELLQKGIDRELVEEILEEQAPDPREKLREIVERKYQDRLRDAKGYRRTAAALQRLGYGYEDIRAVLREFSQEED